ncbi:MAG: CHAT domain-containing tetratricopeptide repeat protein [Mycobacteriales bacterium]|nr:CHAT domain-containing tetratricopeptide repeat protein [Mycobacteriales bacterium]
MRLAALEPRRAAREAASLLQRARLGAEAASVAERALGIACRELLDVRGAAQHLRRAVRLAETGALPVRAGEARLSLALELLQQGRPRLALRELDQAGTSLGDDHAQVHNQLVAVYVRLGRYEVALAAASRALAIAEREGDRSLTALVLGNRGVVHGYRGHLVEAERDLRRAVALSRDLGEALGALDGLHNLGWVLSRGGDLPAALELFDEAERGIADLGVPLAVYQLDRAEALLAAGLATESLVIAGIAAEALDEAGMEATLPEALVLRARAALATGDVAVAAADARRAGRLLKRQGRRGWTVLARALELEAGAGSRPTRRSLRIACEVADALRGAGWHEAELRTRLHAARAAAALGHGDEEEGQLARVADHRTSSSAQARLMGWEAEALLRARAGDAAGAMRSASAGLRALASHQAVLGATELRAAAAVDAGDLGALAVRLALDSGRPATVLAWTERLRASALHRPPVRPPGDRELADDLSALRAVSAELQEAQLRDEPVMTSLVRRQRELEESVRRRAHHARGLAGRAAAVPTMRDLRAALGSRRLVAFFEHDGRLRAVVVHRSATVVDCGPSARASLELRHLSFALRRQVTGDDSTDVLTTGAARLSALLGLDRLPGGGHEPVLVVPTGPLHAVPWSLLPGLRECVVEVAPSLSLWNRPILSTAAPRVLAVAGPDLPAAQSEAADVIAAHGPPATSLVGADATSGRVLELLATTDLAHIACHAVFRADNPLFSALLLEDGPLTVYDLERLPRTPTHVVLSACDSGRHGVRAGDELLGLAAALFALGTQTLVASVVPVDDAATASLMSRFHRGWAAGAGPAEALAAAQRSAPSTPVDRATAAAFVCLRAGRD